jgi:transposase InsO family protein
MLKRSRQFRHLLQFAAMLFTLVLDALRFLIHDRDAIFSHALDQSMGYLGLRVLKTLPQAPRANAICERILGTLRRKCLDFMIPLTAIHLQGILKAWVPHYNTGRPHMALGPGVPRPPSSPPGATAKAPAPASRASASRPPIDPSWLASGILASREGGMTMA